MAESTEKDVDRIIKTVGQAKEDSAFVEAIKLDAQQITGTRYRFRVSVEAETD